MRNSEETMNFILLYRILMCIWTVNPILVDSRPVPIDLRQWQMDDANGVASSNPQQDDSVRDHLYAHVLKRDAPDRQSTHEVGAPENRKWSSNTVRQRLRKNNRGSMKQLKDSFNAQESVGAVKDWKNVPNADSRAPLMNKKPKMASHGKKKKGPSIKGVKNRLEVGEPNNRQQLSDMGDMQPGSKDIVDSTKSDGPNHGRFSSASRNFITPKVSEESISQQYYEWPVTNDVYVSQPSLKTDHSHTGNYVQRSTADQSMLSVEVEVGEPGNIQQQSDLEDIQLGSDDKGYGTKSDVPNRGRFSSAARNDIKPEGSETSRYQKYYQKPMTNDVYVSQPSLKTDHSHTGKYVQRSTADQSMLGVKLEDGEPSNRQQQSDGEDIQTGARDTADGTKSNVPSLGRFRSAAKNVITPKESEKTRSQNYYQRPVTNDVYVSPPSLKADYSHTGKYVQQSAGYQSSLDVKRAKHPSSRSDFSNVDVYLRRALDKINVGRNRRDQHTPNSVYINPLNPIEQELDGDNTMAAKTITSLNRQTSTTRFAPGNSPRKTRDFSRNNVELDDDNTVAAKHFNVPHRRDRKPRYTPRSPPAPRGNLFNPEIGNAWLTTFSNLIGASSVGGKVQT